MLIVSVTGAPGLMSAYVARRNRRRSLLLTGKRTVNRGWNIGQVFCRVGVILFRAAALDVPALKFVLPLAVQGGDSRSITLRHPTLLVNHASPLFTATGIAVATAPPFWPG